MILTLAAEGSRVSAHSCAPRSPIHKGVTIANFRFCVSGRCFCYFGIIGLFGFGMARGSNWGSLVVLLSVAEALCIPLGRHYRKFVFSVSGLSSWQSNDGEACSELVIEFG